jgi:hypothetical protein
MSRARPEMLKTRDSKSLLQKMACISDYSYGEVSSDDDCDSVNNNFSTRRIAVCSWFHSKKIWLGIIMLSITLGTIGLIYGVARKSAPSIKRKQCGSNPTEARMNGCHFEPMLSAWVPTECSFSDLVEEYQEQYGDIHENWPWFLDVNLTQRVTGAELDNLRAGNYSIIYTSYQPSHDLHCLYCWRKVSTALGRNWPLVDARSHEFHHATHCAQHITQILQQRELDVQESWGFPLMFHNCVPVVGG